MLRLMKYLFATAALLVFSCAAFSQKVKFEVGAPAVVAVGEPFRIEFSLNAKPDEFTPPSFTGFDVLAGPTASEGTSVSIVNGNVTKTVSFTYTYVLAATAAGKGTVSAAGVEVDGKTYATRPTVIEAIAEEAAPEAGAGGDTAGRRQGDGTASAAPGTRLGADDLLVRVSVSRHEAYKGQPVRATFKLYTRVALSGIESPRYPAFNGFWVHELDVSGYDWQRETLDGKVYDARVVKEVLLYPQQSGRLLIEQTSMTAIAQLVVQNPGRSQSLFDDFFGGGQTVQQVRRTISAPPVSITVKDFPAGAPASFNGAVGKFRLDAVLGEQTVAANASDAYVLKLSGSGNLPLIQAPKLEMPASFELYNMKTTESLAYDASGISGYRQFEYPFIPRAEGSYTIAPVEFSYFDPEAARYVTLSTAPAGMEVRPDSTAGRNAPSGLVSGVSKEDLKILDRDIRFIRIGDPHLVRKGNFLFGSLPYFLALALMLGGFAAGYVYLKKHLREMRNVTLVRNKKANKVALQRLRAAGDYMNAGDERRFYEEMLRALWGYMSDKLNIPVSNLTKDNIREELQRRSVSPERVERFIGIITECEYAQYSPSSSGQMNEIYGAAARALSRFESEIKK
nr:BatD family protein [uncultured Alistipes sp.]